MSNDPGAEGREAYDAGQSETANPYDPDTDADAFAAWNDGWQLAAEEDEMNPGDDA